MPLERLRSERSFGGSMTSLTSLSISSILGFDDELDQDPTLSDFQQQSLSVFESEHMWAHFKARLADNHIHTTAGVKAMLPEFVNDRVMDGSVQTESNGSFCTKSMGMGSYGSSVGMDRQDSRRTRKKRSVYPAAMRRQESFGRNSAIYGRPRSEHDISSYQDAIYGDTGNVMSLYNCDDDADANLLTSVSRRLSKMTSGAQRSRSTSFFSVMNESEDLRSSNNNSEMSRSEAQLSLMTDDSGSGISSERSRPKYRRPSIAADNDVQAYEHQLFAADANTSPRRNSMESEYSREIAELADEVLLQVADQIEGLDEITNAQYGSVRNVDKLCLNQFSYQPQRHKADRKDNLHVRHDPVDDGRNNNETSDSNEVYCKDDQQEQTVPSSTSTLLVEWGEDYSTSDEEDCYGDGSASVDSEQAVIDREGLVRSSREEEGNSTPAAESKTPKSRPRRGLMSVFSSLALEQGN